MDQPHDVNDCQTLYRELLCVPPRHIGKPHVAARWAAAVARTAQCDHVHDLLLFREIVAARMGRDVFARVQSRTATSPSDTVAIMSTMLYEYKPSCKFVVLGLDYINWAKSFMDRYQASDTFHSIFGFTAGPAIKWSIK